jgi:hypothetical protein
MSVNKNCFKTVVITFLAILAISIIVLSLVPPVSKDALTHHLAVPKLYLEHGGIYEIPDMVFSYYPMNLEMLYMIPLYYGNDIVPKFIHFTFALLTAGLIFSYLKKRIDTLYALLGVLFFLSLPIVVKLSITAYVDLGLIFFSTAALLYLFKWAEGNYKIKYLLFSAMWCGLALGTKYNGLITLMLATFFVPFLYLRKRTAPVDSAEKRSAYRDKSKRPVVRSSIQLQSLKFAIIFFTVSLIVFSPWMIRNTIWTGNPVYPLFNTYINPPKSKSHVEALTQRIRENSPAPKTLNHFSLRALVYNEPWWRIALIPIRIFFEGQDGTPQYFDGKLNPLLFFLPFFAFLRAGRDSSLLQSEKKLLLAFSVIFILLVFSIIDMRIRWMAPAIPPLVILSVFGLRNVYEWSKQTFAQGVRKICMVGAALAVIFLFGLNVRYIVNQFRYVDPISYITGRVGRDNYIERFRKEYPAIQFANDNLPENARILCLFLGNRRYYSDRDMDFDEGLFFRAVKESKSPKEIRLYLRQRKITHLLVRNDLFNKWQMDNFNKRERAVFADFFHDCVNLLFSKYNYGLFELRDTN